MTKHLLYETTDARAKMNCNRRTAMKRSVKTIWVGIEMGLRGVGVGLKPILLGRNFTTLLYGCDRRILWWIDSDSEYLSWTPLPNDEHEQEQGFRGHARDCHALLNTALVDFPPFFTIETTFVTTCLLSFIPIPFWRGVLS